MPNAIFGLDTNAILNDFEARLRKLETYNPQPVLKTDTLMTTVASVSLTAGSFAFSAGWAVAYSQSFTLAQTTTILIVYQQTFYPSGGTASYCYVAQNVDTSAGPLGAINVATNGYGVANSTLCLRVGSFAAGSHTWYGIYHMDAGATTTYNTVSVASGAHPQLDIYALGG